MKKIRSDYIKTDVVSVLLWALTPSNRLVCEIALQTGWRVSDILCIKTVDMKNAYKKKRCTITITEQKTGKRSTKTLPRSLVKDCIEQSGFLFVFEGRDDYRKHRTRQAVFSDLKRAAKKFNIKINLSTHSLRKNYAVYLKEQGKTLDEIRKALNHDSLLVTMLYAMSDELVDKYKKSGS